MCYSIDYTVMVASRKYIYRSIIFFLQNWNNVYNFDIIVSV